MWVLYWGFVFCLFGHFDSWVFFVFHLFDNVGFLNQLNVRFLLGGRWVWSNVTDLPIGYLGRSSSGPRTRLNEIWTVIPILLLCFHVSLQAMYLPRKIIKERGYNS